MNFLRNTAAVALCAAACVAHADSLDSHIFFHTDVIYHSIILEQASDLTVWTDSYMGGINFDPIVGVWHNGMQVGQNDDNPTIAPDQTRYDSGLRLHGLAAGSYVFTIGAFDNFSNSNQIGAGFRYDGQTPIAVTDWCEPASHCNMGPFVKLNWTAMPAVPEPATWMMLAAGLGLAGAAVRRQRR